MNVAITAITALVTWLIARAVLMRYLRYRRKNQTGQEWQIYKAKLPTWVKTTEMMFWIALWLPVAFACIILLNMLYSVVHPTHTRADGVAGGLILMSSLFAALVPAMLLANVACWLLPPIRKANLAAMDGLATASFEQANMGLLKFGSVVIPVCVAVAVLGICAPWAK